MKIINKITSILTSPIAIFVFATAYLLLAFGTFNILTTETILITYFSHFVKIAGLVIIAAALFNRKSYLLDLRTILSACFILIFGISCFISKDFGGLGNNLKGLIWVLLEMLVLFCVNRSLVENKKWIQRFMILLISISSIFVIVSIWMAIVGFMYIPPNLGSNMYWAGMCSGRLYGFYTDPNYGGIIAIITIFSLLYLLTNNRNTLKVFVAIILIALQIVYISLSGSRTTLVALLSTCSLVIFAVIFRYISSKHKASRISKKIFTIIISASLSLLTCGLIYGCIFLSSNAYEKFEPKILKLLNGPISDPIQLFPRDFANKVCEECGLEIITPEDAKYTKVTNEETKSHVEAEHIGLMARTENSDVSNNRFDLWKSAIQIWKTSPVIGVGHNNIVNYSKTYFPDNKLSQMGQTTSHNLIFDLLAGQGLLGLIVFMTIIVLCSINFIRALIKAGSNNYYEMCWLAAIVLNIFISAMFYPEILYTNTVGSVVFWYMLGNLRSYENEIVKIKEIKVFGKIKKGKSKNDR